MNASNNNRPEAPSLKAADRAVFVSARRGRGFSLAELIIVMAIMGIIAAIAAPRYGYAIARYRVDTAAHRIASDLNMAAARAKARSTKQLVAFDLGSNLYTIEGLPDRQAGTADTVVSLGAEPYKARLTHFDAGGGGTRVAYTGFGLSNGAKVVVEVGDYSKTVIVDPDTGVASIQ